MHAQFTPAEITSVYAPACRICMQFLHGHAVFYNMDMQFFLWTCSFMLMQRFHQISTTYTCITIACQGIHSVTHKSMAHPIHYN